MTTPNDLWYRAGSDPAPLPGGTLFDETNTGWGDLANNEDGRAALGFIKAPAYPTYNAQTQALEWDSEGTKWVKVSLPAAPAPDLAALRAAACVRVVSDAKAARQAFTFDGVDGVPADPAIGIVNAQLYLLDKLNTPAEYSFNWRLRDAAGEEPAVWRTWTQADLLGYGAAIGAFIQSVFDLEKAATNTAIPAASTPEAITAAATVAFPTAAP